MELTFHDFRSQIKMPVVKGFSRVGPTGFLQSDDDAKLKIDEF